MYRSPYNMYRSPYDTRGLFLAAPFLGGLLLGGIGGFLGGSLFMPRPFYPPPYAAPFAAPYAPFPGGGYGYPYI